MERINRSGKVLLALAIGLVATCACGAQDNPAILKKFPELAGQPAPDWQINFRDYQNGSLSELLLNGTTREIFELPGSYLVHIGYNSALQRYVVFEERYEVERNGAFMYLVDAKGTIEEKVRLEELSQGFSELRFSPSGRFALATTNSQELILKRRSAENYDFAYVHDVYQIDTATGEAKQVLAGSCRSLGEIHPEEDRFLFTDQSGMICQWDLNNRSVKPCVTGSKAYWNADASAVRYVPALDWIGCSGETSSFRRTGDDTFEFEYDIATKRKTRHGDAGHEFRWSPDRKYGVRIYLYDTLFPLRFNRGKVVLESADRKAEATITEDVPYPHSIFWTKRTTPEQAKTESK